MSQNQTPVKWVHVLALCVLFLSFNAIAAIAGEHPEHPEQPKQPTKPTVDVEAMSKAISEYVNQDTDLKGGYFLIYDTKAEKPLLLNLTQVHEERLAKVGENLYFACCDFKEKSGKMYDLDFFMEEEGGKLYVSEVMVHKEEGQPRYSWYEEGGLWKRK